MKVISSNPVLKTCLQITIPGSAHTGDEQ